MPMYNHKSCALWPKGILDLKNNISIGYHETLEEAVKTELQLKNAKDKPLRTWVLPLTKLDVLSEQMKFVDIKK